MSQPLPRYQAHTERAKDTARLARILAETGEPAPIGHATAGGDERRLRGIPAIGRGVGGAINGTRPQDCLR